jgi:hypothetical protein
MRYPAIPAPLTPSRARGCGAHSATPYVLMPGEAHIRAVSPPEGREARGRPILGRKFKAPQGKEPEARRSSHLRLPALSRGKE